MSEFKLPKSFIRRFNIHSSQKFEKIMKRGAIHAYWDTKNKKDFKWELAESSIDNFLYMIFKFEPEDNYTREDMDEIIKYIISIYEPLMDKYYSNLKRDYPMG